MSWDYLVLCFIFWGFRYNLDFLTEGCLNKGSPSVSWQAKAIHTMTRWPKCIFCLVPRRSIGGGGGASEIQAVPMVSPWMVSVTCWLALHRQCRLKHLHKIGLGKTLCSWSALRKVGGSRACSVVTEPAHNLYSGSWTLSLAETW